MAIRTRCSNCQTVYTLGDHLAGKQVRCKKCDTAFTVRSIKGRADAEESDGGEREKIQTKANAPKRPLVRTDDERDRPRRRSREGDEEPQFVRREGNRGLIIGLIAGFVGLFLLFGGGILAVILLLPNSARDQAEAPTNPPPEIANRPRRLLGAEEDGWPMVGPPEAPPNAVLLHIDGIADDNTREAISEKLDGLAMDDDHLLAHKVSRGDRMSVLVMPVADAQAFSRRLDFGKVNSVNGRTIHVTARKVEGPPPNADAVTRALHQLKSGNANKRQEAVRKLKDTLPDGRRAEVIKALEPLINDKDVFTRQWAIEALGVWGNKDAVPILLKAMQDNDTRREAMKALGRLKDERAAEPIAGRLEELSESHDAAEALKAMGPIAEKAVLARLNHHDLFVRQAVCDILGVIGTKQSIPPLEKVIAAGKDPFAGENFVVAKFAEQAIKAIKARQ